ncbi:hypothetical protein BaOVIS_028610 [Babesia ovis]|uniref:Uncharacterized protein n=1 Tax=Babesia ovis TaxID=5869 RepID=A0A9W5TEI3_BABOV|nr:hypothetical protein BaOVIS_028610 [Babesia ovis]
MDFSPEEERVGIHSAVNLHTKRIIAAYYSIIECSQMESNRDCLMRTDIDNFQLKLHNDSLLHSCRNLHTISSDLVLNSLLHSTDPKLHDRLREETVVAEQLSQMRQKIADFESKLYAETLNANNANRN